MFLFHPGPWFVDVFNHLPGWGLSQKVSELNFLLSIGSQPYHPNLPSRVGFHSWLFGGKKTFHCAAARPIHRQLLIESTQRALVSSTIVFAFVMKIFISHFIICCFFIPNSFCAKPIFCLGKKSSHKFYLNAGFNNPLLYPMCRHTQALHTYRINLSPFTKDFRVWGAPIET